MAMGGLFVMTAKRFGAGSLTHHIQRASPSLSSYMPRGVPYVVYLIGRLSFDSGGKLVSVQRSFTIRREVHTQTKHYTVVR